MGKLVVVDACHSFSPELMVFRKRETLVPPIPKRAFLLGNLSNKKERVRACCFNLPHQPILSEALKEPVAFLGGMFAGLLRLDLNEDPLKEWVTRTVEASGITEDGVVADGVKPEEDAPQQIEIE